MDIIIINIYSENAINEKIIGPTNYLINNKIIDEPICSLVDIISGTVTRELNMEDTLEFTYSSLSLNSKELQLNRIIEVKSDPYRQTQYFRIQSIDKDINGILSIYALHICYDLMTRCTLQWPLFNIDKELLNTDIDSTIYNAASVTENTWSDGTTRYQRVIKCGYFKYNLGKGIILSSDMEKYFAPSDSVRIPVSLREIILSSDYSLLSTFGGEIEFDRFNINHNSKIGTDKGYRIEYGSNLLDYDYTESSDNIYSDILPYWVGDWRQRSETGAVFKNYVQTLCNAYDATKTENVNFLGYDFNLYKYETTDTETSVLAKSLIPLYYTDENGNKKRYNFTKILPVDVTELYDTYFRPNEELYQPPSRVDIAKCGIIYIINNKLGNASVTLNIDFTDLAASNEYEKYKNLMELQIGDTVTISNQGTNILSTAECVKTVYNVVTDSYESMSLGDIKIGFEKIVSKNLKKNNRIIYNKKIR